MRSDRIKKGVNAAPQRTLLHALGLTDKEIEKPLIGIVSSKNDIVPGHMNLDKIEEAVKQGVALAGGVPIVFPAIAVCDGIAMGHEGMKYSLVTRELIADSTEAMATAHPFDGLVMIPNCDKNVPGLLMAAARLNIPTIFVSGGAMLAGKLGKERLSYSNVSEAVSQFKVGKISEEKLEILIFNKLFIIATVFFFHLLSKITKILWTPFPDVAKSLRFVGTVGAETQVYLMLPLVEVSPRALVARTLKYTELLFE